MAGLAYAITDDISIGVEYRLFGVTSTEPDPHPDIGGSPQTVMALDGFLTHSVMVRLTYRFSLAGLGL